jgi:hypothetical protein
MTYTVYHYPCKWVSTVDASSIPENSIRQTMCFWLEPNYDLLNQKLQHPGQKFTTFAGAATWVAHNVKTLIYARKAYSWISYNLR